MKRKPIATVRVLRLPHLADGAVRVEVECSGSVTGITQIPGGAFDMDTPLLTTFAVYSHEERCDAGCDTGPAHERGDQTVREHVEQMAARMRTIRARRYAEGRRN